MIDSYHESFIISPFDGAAFLHWWWARFFVGFDGFAGCSGEEGGSVDDGIDSTAADDREEGFLISSTAEKRRPSQEVFSGLRKK